MSPAKLITGFVCIATSLMAPGLGRAQTCASDVDCSKGLSCQPSSTAAPQVAICSADDAGCRPVDTTATVTMRCQAASCATDADCGPSMVCRRQTSTTCTGGTPVTEKCDPTTGCDPNAVPVPVPAVCTDTVTAKCAYKYELPCNTDTDCGTNFTCQPTTYGMCTGSTGTAGSGSSGGSAGVGGAAGTATPVPPSTAVPPPAPDVDAGVAPTTTCTTVSSYPGYCMPQTIRCTAATDCPATWTCATANTGTAVATAPIPPAGVDAGIALPVVLPPPDTTSMCQPPSTNGAYRGGTAGTDTQSGGTPILVVGDGGTGKGTTTPPTPTAPGNSGGPTTEQTNAAATAGGGGCNVGRGLGSESTWLLAGLAAFALLVARRRRS